MQKFREIITRYYNDLMDPESLPQALSKIERNLVNVDLSFTSLHILLDEGQSVIYYCTTLLLFLETQDLHRYSPHSVVPFVHILNQLLFLQRFHIIDMLKYEACKVLEKHARQIEIKNFFPVCQNLDKFCEDIYKKLVLLGPNSELNYLNPSSHCMLKFNFLLLFEQIEALRKNELALLEEKKRLGKSDSSNRDIVVSTEKVIGSVYTETARKADRINVITQTSESIIKTTAAACVGAWITGVSTKTLSIASVIIVIGWEIFKTAYHNGLFTGEHIEEFCLYKNKNDENSKDLVGLDKLMEEIHNHTTIDYFKNIVQDKMFDLQENNSLILNDWYGYAVIQALTIIQYLKDKNSNYVDENYTEFLNKIYLIEEKLNNENNGLLLNLFLWISSRLLPYDFFSDVAGLSHEDLYQQIHDKRFNIINSKTPISTSPAELMIASRNLVFSGNNVDNAIENNDIEIGLPNLRRRAGNS